MINEILSTLVGDWATRYQRNMDLDNLVPEALTAIYEIGLEVIGADELIDHNRSWDIKEVKEKSIRNNLRADQRSDWAKACGVAE